MKLASFRPGRPSRRGSVLAWLIVCLSVIIGVVALGLDGGRLMQERRHAQAAADAAALAAAADLYNNYVPNKGLDPQGTAASAARTNAAANGYANDGTTSIVTVNIPPQSGAFTGQSDYVEVIVQYNLPATFSAAFTSQSLPVTARTVARGRPKKIGLIMLNGSSANAFYNKSRGQITVADGPISVNSTNSSAYDQAGSRPITATSHEIVGGYVNSGAGVVGPVHTGVRWTPDPLRTVPAPDPSAYTIRSTQQLVLSSPGNTTLQPGVYQGGISVSGQAAVTMSAGVYILQGGGLSYTGQGTLTAQGVMIYNTYSSDGTTHGSINLSGNGQITMTAPTDGIYRGIGIFQDRSLSDTITVTGNGSVQITGTVYAPKAAVQIQGNGTTATDALGGAYICDTLTVSGNGSFGIDLKGNRPKIPELGLVE